MTHYQGPQHIVESLDSFIKLIRSAESVAARVHQPLPAHDLTISQFGVLEALYHLGPMCQRQLAQKILKSFCENGASIGISPEVMKLFRTHHWPGNFRQLHNLLRTAAVMVGGQGLIEQIHLPDDFLEEQGQPMPPPVQQVGAAASGTAAPACAPAPASETDGQRLQDVALVAMTKMLQQHKGNVSAAAKALGVSRNTVYRRKEQLPPDVWN